MVFCSQCGKEATGQLYCPVCGSKMDQSAEIEDLRMKYEGARAMHDSIFRDYMTLKRDLKQLTLEKDNMDAAVKNKDAELKKITQAYQSIELSHAEETCHSREKG
jgi:uncharacterized Zn finger protein (UPF0148 family)